MKKHFGEQDVRRSRRAARTSNKARNYRNYSYVDISFNA